ncbi:RagB/SusD family nutrient uptake outer membrane protein [Sinomicrobium weinanense]|uniref:RagB/SusD family nutrient uptake outer membrane protein n=1 Tax=Sinomicrobium weinanense TaxID=2842200 RepID=A0A926JTE5_9FLAO|nr:RagB/SusD family nutrient uptake outer membrane protein [Sinomicrobium weinanense]MBC9797173.1 RagB/SusD family nutrient uptake outer membrane protein [Sinomicrobium weinanense]MBU3125851.1 RagB/SusD family nutrient uptake outer membrane protein [Sinomicrobium weinanense]
MKKILNIVLVLTLFSLVFGGCSKFLEEDLRDQIAVDNFFNNDQEALLAVNGLYRILHRPSMYRTRGLDNYYVNGADEVGPSRNVNGEIHNYLINEGVADGDANWAACYEIVRNASLYITNLEGNEKISEEIRNQALGESLFIRALAYFHLTNLWGDVPYFRELLPLDELGSLERYPKDEIRADMKEDLGRAFELLPGTSSGSDLGRATKWAAATLKAKFHLFDKEWAATKTECDRIINDSPHQLLGDFAAVFDQTNPSDQYNDEQIFVVDFTTDGVFGDSGTSRTDDYNPRLRDEPKNRNNRPDGPGTPTRWELLQADLQAIDQDMSGFGWAIPLPELADQSNWDPDDLRYDATIVREYLGYELQFPYFRKNWNLNNTSPRSNHNENYVVFRLADIYLMAAEAENEMNGPGNAYPYVNKVRERAFEPDKPWSGMSQQQFREAMYDERKFELCAEGWRRMDLIRWGILLDVVKNVQHRPWNNPASNIQSYHVLLPVPQDEILLNPNLLNNDPTNNGYR